MTNRAWARTLIEDGRTQPQVDRALAVLTRQGWLTRSQRNRVRRLFRQEARRPAPAPVALAE